MNIVPLSSDWGAQNNVFKFLDLLSTVENKWSTEFIDDETLINN